MEIWKEIRGYEGLYSVSNLGRVKNIRREKVLRERRQKNGYITVALYKDKSAKTHLIHRLVADAFVERDADRLFVNHKDEDKKNNRADNLEWCTREYNMKHGTISERIRAKRGTSPRLKRRIVQKGMDGKPIRDWESIAEAARKTGTSKTSIFECCRHIHRSANGFIWEYS